MYGICKSLCAMRTSRGSGFMISSVMKISSGPPSFQYEKRLSIGPKRCASISSKDKPVMGISSVRSVHVKSSSYLLEVAFDASHMSKRSYAKGKDKGKDKKKSGHSKMKLSAQEIDSVISSVKLKRAFESQLEHLREEFMQQLNLRSSIGDFDNLSIATPDGTFPLNQLAELSQKGPQSIIIDMSISPTLIPIVKTALTNSMGINAQQDGTTLFVNLPKVTKEHREALAKTAKGLCTTTKTKLRDVQNKFIHDVKKKKDHHSEDLIFGVQAAIQDQSKEYSNKADQLLAAKVKELTGGK